MYLRHVNLLIRVSIRAANSERLSIPFQQRHQHWSFNYDLEVPIPNIPAYKTRLVGNDGERVYMPCWDHCCSQRARTRISSPRRCYDRWGEFSILYSKFCVIMINCYGVNDESQLMTSDLHLFVNWIDVELVSNAGDEVLRNFILIQHGRNQIGRKAIRDHKLELKKWLLYIIIKSLEQLLKSLKPANSTNCRPCRRLRVVPISRASETQGRVKITHARKGDTRRGERKMLLSVLSWILSRYLNCSTKYIQHSFVYTCLRRIISYLKF